MPIMESRMRGEEVFLDKVRVVLAQNLLVKLNHLHACDCQAFLLKAGQYVANQAALNSTWLENHQCFLHSILG